MKIENFEKRKKNNVEIWWIGIELTTKFDFDPHSGFGETCKNLELATNQSLISE